MVYPVAGGRPNYTNNFIPEIWSGKTIANFYDASVLTHISNTDYEGEISKFGDTVNIRTEPDIEIHEFVKGERLVVQHPESNKLQLLIDKGDYFSCVEDDVDRIQADLNLMEMWSRSASEKMKIKIDQKVLVSILPDVAAINKGKTAGRVSGRFDLGTTQSPRTVNASNVYELIVDMQTVLEEANAPAGDRFLIIPAAMGNLIKKSDRISDASITGDRVSPIRSGRIDTISDMTIYVSHNLFYDNGNFHLLGGHKMGLSFASQMAKMESMRSQETFGDLIRGLQVYGFKVTKGEALTTAVIKLA